MRWGQWGNFSQLLPPRAATFSSACAAALLHFCPSPLLPAPVAPWWMCFVHQASVLYRSLLSPGLRIALASVVKKGSLPFVCIFCSSSWLPQPPSAAYTCAFSCFCTFIFPFFYLLMDFFPLFFSLLYHFLFLILIKQVPKTQCSWCSPDFYKAPWLVLKYNTTNLNRLRKENNTKNPNQMHTVSLQPIYHRF